MFLHLRFSYFKVILLFILLQLSWSVYVFQTKGKKEWRKRPPHSSSRKNICVMSLAQSFFFPDPCPLTTLHRNLHRKRKLQYWEQTNTKHWRKTKYRSIILSEGQEIFSVSYCSDNLTHLIKGPDSPGWKTQCLVLLWGHQNSEPVKSTTDKISQPDACVGR